MLSILITLVAAWSLIAIFAFVLQPNLIYFPSRELEAAPDQIGLAYESVQLTTADQVSLHAWYLPAAEERATLLYLHGNGGNISHRLGTLQLLNQLGLSILIVDYRGYGQSKGRPTEDGTYLDAEAAWRYLIDVRRSPPGRILLFGESLGGGIATWLATKQSPGGLILLSAFTSIRDLARRHYPYLPTALVRIHYPTLERLSRVRCPILIAHSRADEIVPFDHGLRLFENAPEPKQFVELTGRHNDTLLGADASFLGALERFIDASARP
jgi:fermentation-respiration switch protein FrsA (DUF1100 family)